MMQRILTRTRQQIAAEWAQLLWACVNAKTPKVKYEAYLTTFAFPACILLSPPQRRHRDTPANITSSRA